MRLTKVQAAKNRKKIVNKAAELFKTRGIDNVSLADLMKEAGFTHGGFYNHFASKDDLAAEAIAHTFAEFVGQLEETVAKAPDPVQALAEALHDYLTPQHRDAPRGGCPTAALPVDVARQNQQAQSAFAQGLEAYANLFSRYSGTADRLDRQESLVLLSGIVGALILSRSVKSADPALSDELLAAARGQLLHS